MGKNSRVNSFKEDDPLKTYLQESHRNISSGKNARRRGLGENRPRVGTESVEKVEKEVHSHQNRLEVSQPEINPFLLLRLKLGRS